MRQARDLFDVSLEACRHKGPDISTLPAHQQTVAGNHAVAGQLPVVTLQCAWQHAAILTIKGLLPDPLTMCRFVHLCCIMGDQSLYLYAQQLQPSGSEQPVSIEKAGYIGVRPPHLQGATDKTA